MINTARQYSLFLFHHFCSAFTALKQFNKQTTVIKCERRLHFHNVCEYLTVYMQIGQCSAKGYG